NLHPMTLGEFRDLIEAVIDRVGAHAVGDLLELSQILIDLPGIDGTIRPERALPPPKRGVRDAIKLLARRQRGWRHLDRRPEPCPCRGDRRSRNREKRGRNTHCAWSRPALPDDGASLIVPERRCQATGGARPGEFAPARPLPSWRRAARLL